MQDQAPEIGLPPAKVAEKIEGFKPDKVTVNLPIPEGGRRVGAPTKTSERKSLIQRLAKNKYLKILLGTVALYSPQISQGHAQDDLASLTPPGQHEEVIPQKDSGDTAAYPDVRLLNIEYQHRLRMHDIDYNAAQAHNLTPAEKEFWSNKKQEIAAWHAEQVKALTLRNIAAQTEKYSDK